MNLGASAIVLRPRTVAEVMDLACRFTFARALGLYLRLSAAFLLPFFALMVVLEYVVGLPAWALWLIAVPLAIWLQAPFTIAVSRMMFGEEPTTKTVLSAFWSRFGAYTGAMIIKLLLVAFSTAICGVGIFITAPNGTLVPEVTLLEGATAGEAWTRSKRLVTQRSTEAFMALAALSVAMVSFTFGFELFGQALVTDLLQLGKPFGAVLKQGITPFCLAGLFLSAPYIATARFLHYIDTRTRADGWDIQVKFMAISAKNEAQLSLHGAPPLRAGDSSLKFVPQTRGGRS